MTNQGKYEKGLELEAEGKSGDQIAKALGLSGRQHWYDLKYKQKAKNDGMNLRAARNKAASEAIEVTRMQLAQKTRAEQEEARQEALKAVAEREKARASEARKEEERVQIAVPAPEPVKAAAPEVYAVQVELRMTGISFSYVASEHGVKVFNEEDRGPSFPITWEQVSKLQKGLEAIKTKWTELQGE